MQLKDTKQSVLNFNKEEVKEVYKEDRSYLSVPRLFGRSSYEKIYYIHIGTPYTTFYYVYKNEDTRDLDFDKLKREFLGK